jgi:sulfoxide reductase heme-binding subunit YedZ
MAFNPSSTQFKALKAVIFVLALLPFLRMAWLTAAGVPVDPVEFLTHGSGDWALYLLCATLAITPLRRLTGWNWLVRLRRMVGLFTPKRKTLLFNGYNEVASLYTGMDLKKNF